MDEYQIKPKRFTVYHIASTMESKSFHREQDAKRLTNKLNVGNQMFKPNSFAYTTVEKYRTEVVHMVTKINMMSGKEYQEASNTPSYMSPACESYWSM